jgi:hypothetical protein
MEPLEFENDKFLITEYDFSDEKLEIRNFNFETKLVLDLKEVEKLTKFLQTWLDSKKVL